MNWLITGGCGFIGTNLVHRLVHDPGQTHDIRIVDNLSVGSKADLADVADFSEPPTERLRGAPRGVELITGDILDEGLALAVAAGVDAIVHLAGNTGVQPSIENPRLDCITNVVGTLNYLEAARRHGVPHFIFASSGGTVIGDAEPPIHENMVPRPKSPYGASKSACEGYLSAYHGSYGVDTVALRFANVYGPRSHHKNSVVARFIRRALDDRPLEIYGDGDQSRDFIYVDDLVDAIVRAASANDVGGEVFQIATARETTVNELAEALVPVLEAITSRKVQVRHEQPLSGEIRRNYSNTSKAATRLGWQPMTELPRGLELTARWFSSRADD